MMMTIAIIPARGGSKGVPDKNIRKIAGFPLIAYSIVCALMEKRIQRAVISTDSEEIREISLRYGAEVPFLRPKEFSGDTSPDMDFMRHAIQWFQDNEGSVPDYFVHLRPTTPLREPRRVGDAAEMMWNRPEATSLRSGHAAPESPFKWFLKDEQGYFKSIMPHYSNEEVNLPRQSFPVVYIPDGYVDVIKTSFVQDSGMLHGGKMIGFESPVCREVDTLEDLEIIEYEIKKKGSVLLDYLKQKFSMKM